MKGGPENTGGVGMDKLSTPGDLALPPSARCLAAPPSIFHASQVSTRREAMLLEDEASVVCSAPYRPPELTQVEPGATIDERVDVWALGCTLYAMAFGHSPFESPR